MSKTRKKTHKRGGSAETRARSRGLNPRRICRRLFIVLIILSIPALLIGLEWHRRAELADVSVIGSGTPVIVQVQDDNCPLCRRLRRNTEETLEDMEGTLEYRVVNIDTSQGAAFASRHGVSHVTLLLFDGAGRRQQTIEGVTEPAELQRAFQRLQRRG